MHPVTLLHLRPTETVLEVYRKEIPYIGRLIEFVARHFGLSPSEGAHNTLYTATSPIVRSRQADYGGAYVEPLGRIVRAKAGGDDPLSARRMWETSERAVQAM